MKTLGFEFQEVMNGTYTRVGESEPPRRIGLRGRIQAPNAVRHLQDGEARLDGTLEMEGFAEEVPITGTVEITPFTKKVIRYEFGFVANDGRPYRFVGQKNIKLKSFLASMTTLLGTVVDQEGREVARATLKFDVKADLLPILVSWKPALTN